jgi:ABC-type transport system involved in multi-copper enzyme maturation permease subunit
MTIGAPQASIRGLLRAELRKILALRLTWVLAGLFTLFIVGSQILLASGPNNADQLRGDPQGAFANIMSGDLSLLRIFCGIFLLILSAHVVGLEYQYGTIRILLGRGVGRLQLLGAKTLALSLAGLALLVWGLAIELVFAIGITLALAGGQQPWSILGGEFWGDAAIYLLCVLISMGVTLLLGVAASVLGRSLASGLAVGLSWFAVDNLLTIPLTLLFQFTHNDLWRQLSGYLLGLMLNRLPDYIVPPYHVTVQTASGPETVAHSVSGFGILPLVQVDGTHALLVIGGYALIFAATAIVLTRARDVHE